MRLIEDYLKVIDILEVEADRDSSYPFGKWKGERGDIIYLNCEEPIKMLGVLELSPELGVRGRHAHSKKKEMLYFLTGKVRGRYWFKEVPETTYEFIHRPGHMVVISPDLFHEFAPLEVSLAIEFSPQPYDKRDTIYVNDK